MGGRNRYTKLFGNKQGNGSCGFGAYAFERSDLGDLGALGALGALRAFWVKLFMWALAATLHKKQCNTRSWQHLTTR